MREDFFRARTCARLQFEFFTDKNAFKNPVFWRNASYIENTKIFLTLLVQKCLPFFAVDFSI